MTAATLNYAGPLAAAVLAFALAWWLLGARRWFDGPLTNQAASGGGGGGGEAGGGAGAAGGVKAV